MSFIKRLFSFKPPPQPAPPPPEKEITPRETAYDPVLFADWLAKYIILYPTFEKDLDLAPNEEQCKRLEISEKERVLCTNEFVLLRVLGACIFVKNHLDEQY